jgi:hypothetical protein
MSTVKDLMRLQLQYTVNRVHKITEAVIAMFYVACRAFLNADIMQFGQ